MQTLNTCLPTLSFYGELPDQFSGLPILDRKPMMTNWESIKENWFEVKGLSFDSFYQCNDTVFLSNNGQVFDGAPFAKLGVWPQDKFIPFADVKFERVPYYDVIYKLNINGKEFNAGSLAWNLDTPIPEIIGYIVKRGYDDVAYYNERRSLCA